MPIANNVEIILIGVSMILHDHTNCNFSIIRIRYIDCRKKTNVYNIHKGIQVENKCYIVAKCTKSILLERKKN